MFGSNNFFKYIKYSEIIDVGIMGCGSLTIPIFAYMRCPKIIVWIKSEFKFFLVIISLLEP